MKKRTFSVNSVSRFSFQSSKRSRKAEQIGRSIVGINDLKSNRLSRRDISSRFFGGEQGGWVIRVVSRLLHPLAVEQQLCAVAEVLARNNQLLSSNVGTLDLWRPSQRERCGRINLVPVF